MPEKTTDEKLVDALEKVSGLGASIQRLTDAITDLTKTLKEKTENADGQR